MKMTCPSDGDFHLIVVVFVSYLEPVRHKRISRFPKTSTVLRSHDWFTSFDNVMWEIPMDDEKG